ncbi:MAG: hypothetical protein K2Y27_07430 [Xanthobacteraceae bacterium]|nr:hypothetical protein [Xanthobacteraceae bacterium]
MDVALGRRSSKLYLYGNIQPVSSDGREIKVRLVFSLNDSFFHQLREGEIPRSIWGMYFCLMRFRPDLLRLIGWRSWGMYELHIALSAILLVRCRSAFSFGGPGCVTACL